MIGCRFARKEGRLLWWKLEAKDGTVAVICATECSVGSVT